MSEPARPRRRYDSPLRRERAAQTRERIIAAGAKLLHGFPIWNWQALTIPAVAARAEVNERTVYRYFPSERELRDAVMARLEQEAGVDLEGLRLGSLRDVTGRIFEYASQFPLEPRSPPDPTFSAALGRQREALLAAVAPSTEDWADADRRIAAAMLNVLWTLRSYEHLAADWELDPKDAIRGITWVLGLIEEAIQQDRRPNP